MLQMLNKTQSSAPGARVPPTAEPTAAKRPDPIADPA
jgi:hypothetical protein